MCLLYIGMIVFYGGICILFAYLASTLGQVLQAAISVLGLVGGPLLGLYTLGVLFPFVNSLVRFQLYNVDDFVGFTTRLRILCE